MFHRAISAQSYIPDAACVADDEGVHDFNELFLEAIMGLGKVLGYEMVRYNKDGCGWDPDKHRRAKSGDSHNEQVPATVKVGSKNPLKLCEACSALPCFKRRRKRTPIAQQGGQP